MRVDPILATVVGATRRGRAARRGPVRGLALAAACVLLTGCAAVALPFRVTADVVRVVPVAGAVVAAPLDAAGEVID